ncbi:hypothetical protein GOODEAATRI_008647 [Goodea atripinnis]|uniref:Uncharacterized protein n=1 Tax=Goodea atripinnis TaxID=208336 RepID=A0ABV0PM23_9TELE
MCRVSLLKDAHGFGGQIRTALHDLLHLLDPLSREPVKKEESKAESQKWDGLSSFTHSPRHFQRIPFIKSCFRPLLALLIAISEHLLPSRYVL